MLKWLALIACLVAFGATAQEIAQPSQPPIPSGGEVSGNQQPNPTNNTQEAKPDQRGTQGAPLVVQVLSTPERDKEAADIAKVANEEATNNRHLLVVTAIIAGAALLQWIALVWQIILFRRDFNATHRPRLRIRLIQTDSVNNDEVGPTWVTIANVGEGDASDIRFDAVFVRRSGTARIPPWIEELAPRPGLGPAFLRRGQREPYEPRIAARQWPRGEGVGAVIRDGRQTLMIIGRVRYRDANATEIETGFGWTYDPATGEFLNSEKTTPHNYED